MSYDILIRNGRVIDGCGNPWIKTDIAIKNGKIANIGKNGSAHAEKVIDAAGLVVSPGFIDAHAHSDITLLVNPRAESHIRQGITTQVIGLCGFSAAPLTGTGNLYEKMGGFLSQDVENYGVDVNWTAFEEYFDVLERKGIALNICSYVGHGTVRACVNLMENRAPSCEEMERMKALVAKSMEDGAIGLSTGLTYASGCYAKTEEIIELCKVVAKYGGHYAPHIRGYNINILGAIKEAMEIGLRADVPVEISHLAPGPEIFGKTKDLIKLFDNARSRGLDITVDHDTYLLDDVWAVALLPDWAVEGGREKIIERLKNPKIREEIKRDTMEMGSKSGGSVCRSLIKNGQWNLIWLGVSQKNQIFLGKTFPEIAKLKGFLDPFDALFDIILEEEGKVMCYAQHKSQEDVDEVLRYPYSMLGTDGKCAAPYGPLRNILMPRFYGTFPRFLGSYVRERNLLRLEEAIRKITSLPAQRMGLKDRGLIKIGMGADIVVFDPDLIIDTATFDNPQSYPKGIEYVLVNGQVVIEKGEHTGALPGRVLRHMVNPKPCGDLWPP